MIRAAFFVLVGLALIAVGCGILATGPSGGTLMIGVAALVLGGAIILSAARTGDGGGRHER